MIKLSFVILGAFAQFDFGGISTNDVLGELEGFQGDSCTGMAIEYMRKFFSQSEFRTHFDLDQ